MATQQELDDAVIAAAQQLSQQLLLLDIAEKQRVGFKAQKADADQHLTAAKADVDSLKTQVKSGATNLNNAITAANAGP